MHNCVPKRFVFLCWHEDVQESTRVNPASLQVATTEQSRHLRRATTMIISVMTVHCAVNLPWLVTVNLPISQTDTYFFVITPLIWLSQYWTNCLVHAELLMQSCGLCPKEAIGHAWQQLNDESVLTETFHLGKVLWCTTQCSMQIPKQGTLGLNWFRVYTMKKTAHARSVFEETAFSPKTYTFLWMREIGC